MTKGSESETATIGGVLELAISRANWITATDSAACLMALQLARSLDTAFDMADFNAVDKLSQRLTIILKELHLTVATRIQGQQEQESDGSEHRANYLRLLESAPSDSKSGTAKRRASGVRPS